MANWYCGDCDYEFEADAADAVPCPKCGRVLHNGPPRGGHWDDFAWVPDSHLEA